MLKKSFALTLLFALALSACSSDKKDEVSLSEFAAETATITCEWMFACCTADELDGFIGLIPEGTFDSQEACASYYTGIIQSFYSTPAQSAVSAGRGEYFPVKAAQCIKEGAGLACTGNGQTVLLDLLELCDDSYNGLQAEDAECDNQVECSAGLLCHDGTCKSPLAVDEDCSDGPACATGLYCAAGVCTAQAGAGEACDNANSSSCVAGYECTDPGTGFECTAIEIDPVCDGQ